MNRNAIEQYFPGFIKKCYEFEGKKPRRIFGAKLGTEADPLDLYDATAEQILNRKSYHGRGSGKKRIGRKLKLLLAYMMARLGLDHNQFAVSLPDGSSPVLLDWTEPVETLLASIPAL